MSNNDERHRQRHRELHEAVDELAADYITHNHGKFLGTTTVLELLEWSFRQTENPTVRALTLVTKREYDASSHTRRVGPADIADMPPACTCMFVVGGDRTCPQHGKPEGT